MNTLPIESTRWRELLKHRIGLETSVLRALIQWGMAESAADIYRNLEEHFHDAVEAEPGASLRQPVRSSKEDRAFVRELLREAYLRTREIPRCGFMQQRLHDSLLTGFDELSFHILQSYEVFLLKRGGCAQSEKAA
jgi:hypothetical protein